MNKKISLRILLFTIVLGGLLFLPATALAADGGQAGINVSLTTDQADYQAGDTITVYVTVKNSNTSSISNVNIDLAMPDGLQLTSPESNIHIENLAAGQSKDYSFTAKAAKNSAATPAAKPKTGQNKSPATKPKAGQNKSPAAKPKAGQDKSPKTGESFTPFKWLGIAAVAICLALIIYRKKKKVLHSFFLFLCLGTVFAALLPARTASAAADAEGTFTVCEAITVDGSQKVITAVVHYKNTQLYTFNPPEQVTLDSGASAQVTFDKTSPQPAGTSITATVTVSNMSTGAKYKFTLKSDMAKLSMSQDSIDPSLKNTQTFEASFILPDKNIKDFILEFKEIICFTGDTPITTEQGIRRIDEISEGDKVWSWDETSGKYSYQKVVAVTQHVYADKLCYIEVDGQTIKATPTHRFYVEGKGFVQAGDLTSSDCLLDKQGQMKQIKTVYTVESDEPVTVYNLTVEKTHTYFAGGVLVHNAC